jgi:signal transduction histidine kinase/CheY-like chemotaxis protein
LQGFGPYAQTPQHASLLLLQAFMGIWAVMALAVAALVQQRKHSAAEVRRLNEELERRVRSEQAARREAEDANRLKDEFLAMLSHELRTPLNAIVGWSYLLEESALENADARKAIAAIGRNTQALTRLIADLLDISRAASGRLALDLRPCDPRAVIQAAVETVQQDADARSLRLEPSFASAGPLIQADSQRLVQVVWNLLSNAIKFSPAGGCVRVSLTRAVEGQLEIRVEDEGPGIEPAFLPHVFERFRLEDASTTRRHGGLGLGLTIVRNLVELHGGSVSAANRTTGTGAIFTVRLPEPDDMRPAGGVRPSVLAEAAGAKPAVTPSLQGMRILVVDDEADGREALIAVLARYGAEVAAARSAAEGLSALETFRPDLVLSDIQMPDEDGIAFVRGLRALPSERGGLTPAVAVTAYAGPQERAMSLEAGYQLHMAKPVDPAELVRAVVALVDARPTGRP